MSISGGEGAAGQARRCARSAAVHSGRAATGGALATGRRGLNTATGQDEEVGGKVVAACAAAMLADRTGKHWIPLIDLGADAVPPGAAVLGPSYAPR